MKRASLITLVVLAIVSVLELSAVAADNTVLEHLTKPLLLPLLIIFVLVEVGWNADPSIKFLIIGQFFSFLGDVALMFDGDLWFALGIGMFLITHIFYLIGFFKIGAREGLRERRWVLVAYPLFWLAANAALWSGLGPLRIPIIVYSAFLVAMAMCSMSLGTLFGIGGALFMVSDLLIGETVAYGAFPGSGVVIMLTYIVGQAIIAYCWTRRVEQTAAVDVVVVAA
ncbi:MAG: lysoplasmalogenase [Candidatus Nanopelagicales bacterium]